MRYCSRNIILCWALATASPLMLSGQAIPDRRFLDSVLTEARAGATAAAEIWIYDGAEEPLVLHFRAAPLRGTDAARPPSSRRSSFRVRSRSSR